VDFTAAESADLERLRLAVTGEGSSPGYLLAGGYGAGKSHFLQVAEEMALAEGFAVSRIVLNAYGGVRFNRMDQVFGAIASNLRTPDGRTGPGAVLTCPFTPGVARAKVVSTARRAYVVASKGGELQRLIHEWLEAPWRFPSRARMPDYLGEALHRSWNYGGRPNLDFRANDYEQSWEGLAALHHFAVSSGFRGLVLLIDEFEDVVENLNNCLLESKALGNLYRLLSGGFPGTSFYAVTPEFEDKVSWSQWGNADEWLEDLSNLLGDPSVRFDVARPSVDQYMQVARRIREAHALAYGWDAELAVSDSELLRVVRRAFRNQGVDQLRQTTQEVVRHLDEAVDDEAA
jgi:hypothetical protein